ncbi:hypothetical protein K431DRAFT_285707 [Polychaeton citri CBS 116435]|uniref:Uncharacterized protein n=1 Tax=Polychaeton citri CBS 116435 TaxID=1314669 RepID=A0A9P4ULX1_9PEZI|nr:hypothetical protein K431DRAFT_285707 [Polychaeton citri CBS 116435]
MRPTIGRYGHSRQLHRTERLLWCLSTSVTLTSAQGRVEGLPSRYSPARVYSEESPSLGMNDGGDFEKSCVLQRSSALDLGNRCRHSMGRLHGLNSIVWPAKGTTQ